MSLRYTRQYATLPSLPTRGPVPPMVSVIMPLARTNLVLNPLLKNNSTGWAGMPNSIFIASIPGNYYHSGYGSGARPNISGVQYGLYYLTSTLAAGTPYVASVKFRVDQPRQDAATYAIAFATTGGVDLAVYRFKATGRWQWIWVFWNETSNAARRIYIRRDDTGGVASGSAADAFSISGLQLESCADGILAPTTYIDGDQQGLLVGQQPPAYGWNGLPHASTSYRTVLTRAGGYLVNLSAYNFLLTGLIGLGMAAPNNVSIPYTVLDGARYLRTTKPPRTISMPGRFQADDWWSYQQGLSAMRAALDRDQVGVQQPLVLQVEPQDECGNVVGDFAQIQCLYAGGLEGDDGNLPEADVAPTFTMYLPYLIGGAAGASLGVQQGVANANDILMRSPGGVWSALGTGATGGAVQSIVIGLDGKVYAGGLFTSMGGVANTAKIAYWDGSAWNAMGTGASGGDVQSLAVGPDGSIYAAGSFTLMGGVANTVRIAKWNGSAWSALSTGITTAASTAYVVAVAQNGIVYAAGNFTAPATRIAKWNGSAWSGLGTGLNDIGDTIAFDRAGNVYVGGDFTTANGVAVSKIAKWNGTTFVALAGGLNASVIGLAFDIDGTLYATGIFTNAAYPNIARWNGTAWSAVAGGLNNNAYGILATPVGIYVGGIFTASGTTNFSDGFALYNRSVFVPPDVDLPASSNVRTIARARDGTIYIGYNQTGTATVATVTTVINPAFGEAPIGIAYPTLIIKGPTTGTAIIYQIVNLTTGIGVYFTYTINAGETATFIFDPTNPSYSSDFQGDLTSTILPGSQPALFYLAPGSNSISFFATDSTVSAVLFIQKRYNGLADLIN